jgi:hypothetical protein
MMMYITTIIYFNNLYKTCLLELYYYLQTPYLRKPYINTYDLHPAAFLHDCIIHAYKQLMSMVNHPPKRNGYCDTVVLRVLVRYVLVPHVLLVNQSFHWETTVTKKSVVFVPLYTLCGKVQNCTEGLQVM